MANYSFVDKIKVVPSFKKGLRRSVKGDRAKGQRVARWPLSRALFGKKSIFAVSKFGEKSFSVVAAQNISGLIGKYHSSVQNFVGLFIRNLFPR